ncbi:CubicO group peptidase (beta-lactamase class C family) [Lactobacillus colini]|uniref:CubicO group peptidase (Beta-lactamase class C family) n=1 Tax=Lactobacillus colini TaxID=1819254 RepID=A0ABS4MGS9_9LACO|nr:serine hydrolase domain-containing protein [Lactobacillus colini]MBP2058915.1 CubicO group peptidase (beta-lactamase class C family) [Lactobacillus colini]
MKRKLLAAATALTLALAPTAALFTNNHSNNIAYAATTTSSQDEMYNFVRETMRQNKVRGSVTVVKDGIPQNISYGYAWYGKRLGAGNAKIVYPTGSLQKVITGAMIVQLINEKINTDQSFSQYTKISRWYPNLKNADKITVGQLLTHTSGITATGTEVNRGYNYSEQGAIDWLVNKINTTPEAEPGTYFYNNANYILLVGIIRQLTGQSYEQNFQTRIIDKLGLTNTYLYQNIPYGKTDAISYIWNNKNYQNPAYMKRSVASQIPGAGNLFSTPYDYYKIQVGLSNGQILSSSDFHYLTHLNAKITDYSGGMYLKDNDTLKSAYGNIYGLHFGSWVQLTTDNKNGIVMFLNQTNGNENAQKDVGYAILNHIKANTFLNR